MIDAPMTNLVVIDLETTGTNPFHHDVLAVALVPLNPNAPSAIVYVKPDVLTWSDHARQLFEKYESAWQIEAVSPSHACVAIEDFLATTYAGVDATPVGHNVGFDLAFLKKLAFLGGRERLAGLSHRAVDTHTLLFLLYLQGRIPSEALASDGAFHYFGIHVEESARHTALGDATATRELLARLLDTFSSSSTAARYAGLKRA